MNTVPNNIVLIEEEHNLTCSRKIMRGGEWGWGRAYKSICGKDAVYSNGITHYCLKHSLKQRISVRTVNKLMVHDEWCYNMDNSKILGRFDTVAEAMVLYEGTNDNIGVFRKHGMPIHVKFKI